MRIMVAIALYIDNCYRQEGLGSIKSIGRTGTVSYGNGL